MPHLGDVLRFDTWRDRHVREWLRSEQLDIMHERWAAEGRGMVGAAPAAGPTPRCQPAPASPWLRWTFRVAANRAAVVSRLRLVRNHIVL